MPSTDLKSEKLKQQNPWISLLRIYMCFGVIQIHFPFYTTNILLRFFILTCGAAVPCFMFLSFFFMGKDIIESRYDKLQQRLVKLYVPIFVYGIVYWCTENVAYLLWGKKEEIIKLRYLVESLLVPHHPELDYQLWFLFDQIIILVVFFVLLSYFKSNKSKIAVLIILLAFSFMMQYTGMNYELFTGAGEIIRNPLARVFECIPYAVSGLLFWYLKDAKPIAKTLITIVFAFATYISMIKAVSSPPGYGYSGIGLFFLSISICLFVFILPDVIKGKLRVVINYLGSCTMGIYFLHLLVGWILSKLPENANISSSILQNGTFIFDFSIFAICLLITIIIKTINKKINCKWVDYIA